MKTPQETPPEAAEAPAERLISFSGEKQPSTAVYPEFFRNGAADLLLAHLAEERPGGSLEFGPFDCIYVVGGEPEGPRTISVIFQERTVEETYAKPDSRTYKDVDLWLFGDRHRAALERIPAGTVLLGSDYLDSELTRRRIGRLVQSLRSAA